MQCGLVVSAEDEQLLQKLQEAAEKGELLDGHHSPDNQLLFILLHFCCRAESSRNSFGTCTLLSSVTGETGTFY